MAGFAVPFPTVVIAEILGVDPARRADFRRWSEHMVLAVFEPMSPEQRDAVLVSGNEMGTYLDVVFAERLGSTEEDMVSLLLRAELEGGALTRQELGVFVATLLVAGSITTAYLIGSAVMQLAQEPRLLGAVRADPTLVGAVVEETLRHQSPIQMMFRTATSDIDIAGTTIPNNATVLALLGSANRDEQMFTNPDSFDIRRPVRRESLVRSRRPLLPRRRARPSGSKRCAAGDPPRRSRPRAGRHDGAHHLPRLSGSHDVAAAIRLTHPRCLGESERGVGTVDAWEPRTPSANVPGATSPASPIGACASTSSRWRRHPDPAPGCPVRRKVSPDGRSRDTAADRRDGGGRPPVRGDGPVQ